MANINSAIELLSAARKAGRGGPLLSALEEALAPGYRGVVDALEFGRGDQNLGRSLWFTDDMDTARDYAAGSGALGLMDEWPQSGQVVDAWLQPSAKILDIREPVPPGVLMDMPRKFRREIREQYGDYGASEPTSWDTVFGTAELSDKFSNQYPRRFLQDAGYSGVKRNIGGDNWNEFGLWDKSALGGPTEGATQVWRGLHPRHPVVPDVSVDERQLGALLAALKSQLGGNF